MADITKGIKFKVLVPIILIAGIMLRFAAMHIGHNYDFDSYMIVGNLASKRLNVYANTARYNYGPVFFCIQGFLYFLASFIKSNLQTAYRLLIVSVLTLADLGLFCYLLKKFSLGVAAFFFLNPVSIIITGYHNQFDNIAILIMLIAVEFYDERSKWSKRDIAFILLFGLSLMTKHLFYIFPVWLLLRPSLPFKKKIVYFGAPILIFLMSFFPFIRHGGLRGIVNNVFMYRSCNNFPLLGDFANYATNVAVFHGQKIPFILLPISVAIMCALGYALRKEKITKETLVFLICLVTFSSAVANQYLVIPLVGIAALSKYGKYIYSIFVSLFLMFDVNGFHLFQGTKSGSMLSIIKYFESFGFQVAVIILLVIVLKNLDVFKEKVAKYI